jgi:hypothetical protein
MMHCRMVLCTHVASVYTCIKYEHGSPCDVKTHGAASLAVMHRPESRVSFLSPKRGEKKKTTCAGLLPMTVIYIRFPFL